MWREGRKKRRRDNRRRRRRRKRRKRRRDNRSWRSKGSSSRRRRRRRHLLIRRKLVSFQFNLNKQSKGNNPLRSPHPKAILASPHHLQRLSRRQTRRARKGNFPPAHY